MDPKRLALIEQSQRIKEEIYQLCTKNSSLVLESQRRRVFETAWELGGPNYKLGPNGREYYTQRFYESFEILVLKCIKEDREYMAKCW